MKNRFSRVLILVTLAALALGSALPLFAQDDVPPVEDLISDLPEELQLLYVNALVPILPSAYDDFEAVDPPWHVCYSESYQGNPWRVATTNELVRLVEIYQDAGLISEFEMTDSNGDIALQISQIRSFIDKGCDIILAIAGSSTGLDEVVQAAYDAGIPFVTASSSVTSPYAINVDSNFYRWGYEMAEGIVEQLDGAGNVLMVEGIAGAPIVEPEREGAMAVFEQYPDINIVARVNGDWTPSVTKSVVLQTLATSPTDIDAVWTTGSESRVIAETFQEAGRPAPLISGSISGDALGYWNANPENFNFYGHGVLPTWTAQTLFRVGVRMLQGQHPRLNAIMIPIPEVRPDELDLWAGECMTPESVSIFPVAPTDPMPPELMDAYFVDGEPIEMYDYSQTPDPCAAEAE